MLEIEHDYAKPKEDSDNIFTYLLGVRGFRIRT